MMVLSGHLVAGEITVKGSDTLVVLAQRWAETYMAGHPGVRVQVTGGGTGTGFAALLGRTTDICTASRRISRATPSAPMVAVPVSWPPATSAWVRPVPDSV